MYYHIRTLLIVVAIAGCRESTPAGSVAQSPSQIVASENAKPQPICRLVGPPVHHQCVQPLYLIENLYRIGTMMNVVVNDVSAVRGMPPITAQDLPAIMKSATPVPPDAKLIDEWHYSP